MELVLHRAQETHGQVMVTEEPGLELELQDSVFPYSQMVPLYIIILWSVERAVGQQQQQQQQDSHHSACDPAHQSCAPRKPRVWSRMVLHHYPAAPNGFLPLSNLCSVLAVTELCCLNSYGLE